MIARPTVLVVGAGGSAPFTYPLGWPLLQRIVHNGGDARLQNLGYAEAEIRKFTDALRASGRLSVDAFLEHRREFLEIGKSALAVALIPHEHPHLVLGDDDRRPSWYDLLFQKLNAKPGELHKNHLSILTFNYDRSLDFYLRTTVCNSYGCSEADALGLLASIPITHLHGQLDTLDERPYSPDMTKPELIRKAGTGIRVIHEDVLDGDSRFTQARQYLAAADRVYFVGFGYDPTNLARLGIPGSIRGDAEIFCGALNMTMREREVVMRHFDRAVSFGSPVDEARQFLREAVALDAM